MNQEDFIGGDVDQRLVNHTRIQKGGDEGGRERIARSLRMWTDPIVGVYSRGVRRAVEQLSSTYSGWKDGSCVTITTSKAHNKTKQKKSKAIISVSTNHNYHNGHKRVSSC